MVRFENASNQRRPVEDIDVRIVPGDGQALLHQIILIIDEWVGALINIRRQWNAAATLIWWRRWLVSAPDAAEYLANCARELAKTRNQISPELRGKRQRQALQ